MDENNDIYYSTAPVWEIAIKHCIRPDDMIVDARLFEKGWAKKDLVMIGDQKALAYAVKNVTVTKRNSLLRERLSDNSNFCKFT